MKSFFSLPTTEANVSKKNHLGRLETYRRDDETKIEERFADSRTPKGVSKRDGAETIEIKVDGPVVSSTKPTKLFSMIEKRNWPAVVKRCKGEDSKEAMTWVVEKNRDESIRWKLLPIHQACENKAPSEVIKALVAAYSDSLFLKDSGGDLPLHLACRERASKSVIGALLAEGPDAAKVKDDEGRLPLHLACRQGTAVQVVDSLIICFYRGTRTPDAYELLPIHWACAQNASPAIVEALLRANPDSVDLTDKWGRTPLSLAQASTNPEKGVIVEALKKDPSYWNSNLVEEIETLTEKLDKSSTREMQSEMKVKEIEEQSEIKIKEIEEESDMKIKKLEDQNKKLRDEIKVLTTTNKYSDDDLDKINQENLQLANDIKYFQTKLNEYADVFKTLEVQRVTLLKVTEEMGQSLKTANKINNDENRSWKKKRNSYSTRKEKKMSPFTSLHEMD